MPEPIVLAVAVSQFDELEGLQRAAVLNAIDRLRTWPRVSGVKALAAGAGGSYRIRCGSVRILFDIVRGAPHVTRIGERDQVYNVHKQHRQAKPEPVRRG